MRDNAIDFVTSEKWGDSSDVWIKNSILENKILLNLF